MPCVLTPNEPQTCVPDRNTLPGSPRRFRAGAVLGLSLDTQIAATSPDKSGDQVSCPVKGKCQSFASCKQNMTRFWLTVVTTCYRYQLLFKVKRWRKAGQFLAVFLLAQIHTQRMVKVKLLPTPKLGAAQQERLSWGSCLLSMTHVNSPSWFCSSDEWIEWTEAKQQLSWFQGHELVWLHCTATLTISISYRCDYTRVWSAQKNDLGTAGAACFNRKFLTTAGHETTQHHYEDAQAHSSVVFPFREGLMKCGRKKLFSNRPQASATICCREEYTSYGYYGNHTRWSSYFKIFISFATCSAYHHWVGTGLPTLLATVVGFNQGKHK